MHELLMGASAFWASFTIAPHKIINLLEGKGARPRSNAEYVAPEAVRLAAVQLQAHPYLNLKQYVLEMYQLASEAAESGAQLVVFPAYTGLLAGSLLPGWRDLFHWARTKEGGYDQKRVHTLAETFHNALYEAYIYTFSTIAKQLKLYVVGGTSLFLEEGELRHRCVLFDPKGQAVGTQDKTALLGLDHQLGVTPSDWIEVVDTPMGRVAMVLTDDAYYFECFQIAKAQGAKIIACPCGMEQDQLDLLRCRATESGAYLVYACLQDPEQPGQRACILAPTNASVGNDGVVAVCDSDGSHVVSARTNLERLPLSIQQENLDFIYKDFLKSYQNRRDWPLLIEPDQDED